MNTEIKLTIGIPSIPERMTGNFLTLFNKISKQIGEKKDIEIISLIDNKIMSVGRKRNLLFSLAQGRYVCIIDDDDDITDNFIETLRSFITQDLDVDVICYNQEATINGETWVIKTNINNNKVIPFDQLEKDRFGNPIHCNRPPWHWCAWKTDFVKSYSFGNINWGEDAVFVAQASIKAKTQLVIDKVLCKYKWDQQESAAPHQPIPQDILDDIEKKKVSDNDQFNFITSSTNYTSKTSKKYFINYAAGGFLNSQKEAIDTANYFGFNAVPLSPNYIDEEFYKKNEFILSQRRGAGYWLWKPYIIDKFLGQMSDGDYLVYMDSGAKITHDISEYLEMTDNEKGHIGFSMIQRTSKWTKGDCFYEINKNRDYQFAEKNQLQATYLFFRNCSYVRNFVSKWLNFCCKVNLIADSPNTYLPNMSDFVDHRHDQSIYSLLCYNENIPVVPQIDQFRREHGLNDNKILVDRHGRRH